MFILKGYLDINRPDEYATAEAPEAKRSNFVMLGLETFICLLDMRTRTRQLQLRVRGIVIHHL